MLETIIRYIIKKLSGITGDQWEQILVWVETAAHELTIGHEKRAWVTDQMRKAWPTLRQHAVDLLVGLAVAFAEKKGIIKLNTP